MNDTYTAHTLVDFIKIIDELKPDDPHSILWFRGQSDARHQLIPSVLRKSYECDITVAGCKSSWLGKKIVTLDSEAMLQEFKQLARPFLSQQPQNDFEWMFIAQHHGLPTRLLDWSTNALVALYFAVQGAPIYENEDKNGDEGAAVFVIDPLQINNQTVMTNTPAQIIDIAANADEWDAFLAPNFKKRNTLPICITAPHMTKRIRAQNGVFTLHGSYIRALDAYDALKPFIKKIFVPYTATRNILESLALMGINESFIYPSLDSVAKDIAKTATKRYEYGQKHDRQ